MPRRAEVTGTPDLAADAIKTLEAAQRGDVLQRGQSGYDEARALFNSGRETPPNCDPHRS